MIPRELNLVVDGTTPSTPVARAVELQQALWAWKNLSDQAAAGIAAHDLGAADAALESREELRPRIERLVGNLQAVGGAPDDALDAIGRLQRSAAEADARLINVLEGERFRLRRDMDGVGRPSAPASAYGRATAEKVHRLDIVR